MNDATAPTDCHSRSRNARRASETERELIAEGNGRRGKEREKETERGENEKRMDSKYVPCVCDRERRDRHGSFRSSAKPIARMDAGHGTGTHHR